MEHGAGKVTRARWLASMRASWHQGEHVAIMGPTGSGKTFVEYDLLSIRSYACVVAVKREDDTLKRFHGYKVIKHWPPDYRQNRVIFWPRMQTLNELAKQRASIINFMQLCYLSGGWCTCLDDMSYMVEHLRIKSEITTLFNQGRSLGISAVTVCTRPTGVPRPAFNQASHIIIFKFHDLDEMVRAAQIAGIGRKTLEEAQAALGQYEFLSVHNGTVTHVGAQ